MTRKTISDAVSNISTEYIEKAADYTVTKKVRKPVWFKWAAMAACLCLVVAAVLTFRTNSPTIINEYNGGTSISYTETPTPGEYYCYADVAEAREHYLGKNVTFLLAFELFGNSDISDTERNAEYQRLVDLGYQLYETECWTYSENGEKEYLNIIVGAFTEEELSNFDVNPNYGYVFYFASNGDGTGISVDESELITNYGTQD